MGIKQVTCYAAICDECGDGLTWDGDFLVHCEDEIDARETMESADWGIVDGKHYCSYCFKCTCAHSLNDHQSDDVGCDVCACPKFNRVSA